MCPGDSGGGMGQQWPAAGSGALRAAVHAQDLLKDVAIIFIYLHHSLVSGGTQPYPSQKTGLKIY